MHLRRDGENASKASGSSMRVTTRALVGVNILGGIKGGCRLRTVSRISPKEKAQSTPLHKGRMRQDFSLGH